MNARLFSVIGPIACALLLMLTLPAAADDWITVTQCNVVVVDGVEQQEVTFDLHNLSTLTMYSFAIYPNSQTAPQDTCHIVSAPGNENWVTSRTNDGGYVWSVSRGDKKIPGGGMSLGLKATFSHTSCCWKADFAGVTDPYAFTSFCTPCPFTTAVRPSSWGQVRSQYR